LSLSNIESRVFIRLYRFYLNRLIFFECGFVTAVFSEYKAFCLFLFGENERRGDKTPSFFFFYSF